MLNHTGFKFGTYFNILVVRNNFYFFWYVLETSRWLPEKCFHICTASKLTGCRSKRENMLIQLNITATTKSIIFPISQYESPVRCSNCHNVQSIVINCNIDSVFDIKGKNIFFCQQNHC